MGEEIKHLRERQSGLETQAIELLVELEPLNEQLVHAEAAQGELEAKRAAHDTTLAGAAAGLEAEIATAVNDREAAAGSIDADRMETYRKMRITYGPDAVVEFDPDHNGGCPVAMSAVELDRWKHLPAGTLEPCVDCGRLVAKLV
jgi:predicted  nucleic acid-binding Zn-ribbon protein